VIVVSRGLKLLRPIVKENAPSAMRASGSALFARPGSESFAYWPRSSLKSDDPNVFVTEAVTVSVFTSESPECSTDWVAPPFSLLTPVNRWPL